MRIATAPEGRNAVRRGKRDLTWNQERDIREITMPKHIDTLIDRAEHTKQLEH